MDEEASKRQPKTPKRTNKGCLPDSASEDDGPALPTNQGSEKKEEKQVVKQETNGNKDVKVLHQISYLLTIGCKE